MSYRWLGFGAITALLGILTACPEVGRMTFRFDLATGKGELMVEDIGTDDPTKADEDFAQVVNEYVLGSKVQDDHPSWRVGAREFVPRDGRLDAKVAFDFARPEDVGLYKYDKKSPWFWCGDKDEEVVSTNGTAIPQYPNCVAFDRKLKQLEVTVSGGGTGKRLSLLPQFEAWDGKPLATADGGLGGMFGDAFQKALQGQGDGAGAGGDADAGMGVLRQLLPQQETAPAWKALGLPLPNSQVVFQTDSTFQATHDATDEAAVLKSYTEALGAQGWSVAEDTGELVVWQRDDGAKLTGTATRAGAAVIVSISQ
ncbi:MAG: hypothetical protein R3F59_16245 [Myxococcota bacterium]